MSEGDYENLARSLVNLDADGFRRFAGTFGPRFRAMFIRRGLNASEAEDLAVSCVTDIAMKVPAHYRPGRVGGFQRWVFVLAHHALVDWMRSRPPPPVGRGAEVMDVGTGQDLRQDLGVLEAVDEALERLTPAERAVVELRDLGVPHDYEEIGRRLGIQTVTARVYHHRALKRLRAILEVDPRIQPLLQEPTCRPSERHD